MLPFVPWILQVAWIRHGATPWKMNMEPINHPFRKENHLPNLHDYVPCQSTGVYGVGLSYSGLLICRCSLKDWLTKFNLKRPTKAGFSTWCFKKQRSLSRFFFEKTWLPPSEFSLWLIKTWVITPETLDILFPKHIPWCCFMLCFSLKSLSEISCPEIHCMSLFARAGGTARKPPSNMHDASGWTQEHVYTSSSRASRGRKFQKKKEL